MSKPEFLVAEAELAIGEARRAKSERTKHLGEPIQLQGKALDLKIRGGHAWIAENTAVARKIDLQTGKTLALFKGHSGPVTAIDFFENVLISGSWDKTIKLWNADTRELISSTDAHSDFLKCFLVLPSLKLLVSGGSDKIVRFWDLSDIQPGKPLTSVGSISSHTRPISCLDGFALSDSSATLYTADSMGVVRIWELTRETGDAPRWKSALKTDLTHHRTGINQLLFGNGQLWTASADDTVQLLSDPKKAAVSIPHPKAVRAVLPLQLTELGEPHVITGAGDIIYVYDVSTPETPELINQVDAHWHDVTALLIWARESVHPSTQIRSVEPWVVSTSLDGTIRKWKLAELLTPAPKKVEPAKPPSKKKSGFEMTEDEERELAELMDDSD